MASHQHKKTAVTHLILPSIYKSIYIDNLEPKYANTLATLINGGILVNTVKNNYTAFITAILGLQAVTPGAGTGTSTGTGSGSGSGSGSGNQIDNVDNIYRIFEEYIFKVIQYITDGISLDSVLAILTPLQTKINTAADAANTLYTIQNTMFSLFESINVRTDISGAQQHYETIGTRIDISGVQARLSYLETLLEKETNLEPVYVEINEFLVAIIGQITNKAPYLELLEDLTTGLITLQMSMLPQIQYADDMMAIQELLINIITNIINGYSLDIVLIRLDYVNTLLANIRYLITQ